MVREAASEAAYNAAADKLGRASPRDKPRVLREMANIAEKFAGTKFGDCAAEASRGSATSQKRPKTGKRTDDK